jgi:hypothetical protein
MGGRDKKIKKLLSAYIRVYLWLKKYSRGWTQMQADRGRNLKWKKR